MCSMVMNALQSDTLCNFVLQWSYLYVYMHAILEQFHIQKIMYFETGVFNLCSTCGLKINFF